MGKIWGIISASLEGTTQQLHCVCCLQALARMTEDSQGEFKFKFEWSHAGNEAYDTIQVL